VCVEASRRRLFDLEKGTVEGAPLKKEERIETGEGINRGHFVRWGMLGGGPSGP